MAIYNTLTIIIILTLLDSLYATKIIQTHLDWKHSNGETLLYAVRTKLGEGHSVIKQDLAELGLHAGKPCLYIDHCIIYTHEYQMANGTCSSANTTCAPIIKLTKEQIHVFLDEVTTIDWYAEIWERQRFKRSIPNFNDPAFHKQWHLNSSIHVDLNVLPVWEQGITGAGITVAVVDDGLEWDNPDLADNYNPEGSIDLNDDDNDPMPNETSNKTKDHNRHGTRCAGEIAAVANNRICGVGVAYGASIAGVRALDGSVTDLLERDAFAAKHAINDIYSCSWGPEDDGKTVDGPHTLAEAAIKNGILKGRNGYGSIYVVASGNGGFHGDNCNFDGYANSIYFVAIGAVDSDGKKPAYAEDCASMLAVTPGGGGSSPGIVTTDLIREGDGCTLSGHSGTSAAAPLAAGVIALALSVNPCLTWRDIQHITILSATRVDPSEADWIINAADLSHSHKHGFGLLNAWFMVNIAKVWRQMPVVSTFYKEDIHVAETIRTGKENTFIHSVSRLDLEQHNLQVLEHVKVTVTMEHKRRGNLQIELKCPNLDHKSILASYRPLDSSDKGFNKWSFSTVRCWGEEPSGTYVLTITDKGSSFEYKAGTLLSWSLTLYGSSLTTREYKERIQLARTAQSGALLTKNWTVACEPPPTDVKEKQRTIPYKLAEVVTIIGCFLTLAAVYNTIEDICRRDKKNEDNNQEKTNHSDSVTLNMSNLTEPRPVECDNIAADLSNSDNEKETTALLNS